MQDFFYMAWTTNDIMILVGKLVRKNQAGSISADDLFYHWNAEQNMYYQDVVGRWQARANGKSGLNTGLILNETSLSDLAPFTISVTLNVASGQATKPSDFEFRISLRVGGKKVFFIRPDQIPYVNDSVIDAPSVANSKYYATEYEDYYSFLPASGFSSVVLDYIASPTDIKWAYTYDAEDRQVYNEGQSVNPKWSQATIITITKRTLNTLGVSWKDADFAQAGKSAQMTGE